MSITVAKLVSKLVSTLTPPLSLFGRHGRSAGGPDDTPIRRGHSGGLRARRVAQATSYHKLATDVIRTASHRCRVLRRKVT